MKILVFASVHPDPTQTHQSPKKINFLGGLQKPVNPKFNSKTESSELCVSSRGYENKWWQNIAGGRCGQADSAGMASARPDSPCLRDLFDPTCTDLIVLERRRRVGCWLRAGLHTKRRTAQTPPLRPTRRPNPFLHDGPPHAHPFRTVPLEHDHPPRLVRPGHPRTVHPSRRTKRQNPSCHPLAPQSTQDQTSPLLDSPSTAPGHAAPCGDRQRPVPNAPTPRRVRLRVATPRTR